MTDARKRALTGLGHLLKSDTKVVPLTPDRQRGRMSDAEPPMETSGDKENRTYQESADAADYRKGTAAGETVQLCLMPVNDDQHRKDPEAESQADQTQSGRRLLRCHVTPNVIAISAQKQSMLPIQ